MKIGKKEIHKQRKLIFKIKKLEQKYSCFKYKGRGKKNYEYIPERSPFVLSASHSIINENSQGNKNSVCKYTGAVINLLAKEAGSSVLYLKKQIKQKNYESVLNEIKKTILQKEIQVFLDIQIADDIKSVVVIDSKIPENDKKYGFINKILKYSFEYEYGDWEGPIVETECSEESNIIKKASEETGISYVALKISSEYFNVKNPVQFKRLYTALSKITVMLANLDWKAEHIEAFRLWQSSVHKPQDKVELSSNNEFINPFDENSLLNVCTYGTTLEKVRLYKVNEKSAKELKNNISQAYSKNQNEYIFLTNRLIDLLFGREWIEGQEEKPGLLGAPIILYENEVESYAIGLPKANQIDGIFFSSALYESKLKESEYFDYVLFNRLTDSRIYIDFKKADYEDFGRVKDIYGNKAKKIMLPRYYRKVLGYLDKPIRMIRSEEFKNILSKLNNELMEATDENAKKKIQEEIISFGYCYEKVIGEVFHQLKQNLDPENPEIEQHLKNVSDVQERYGFFSNVELLRVPKERKTKIHFYQWVIKHLDKIRISVLKRSIGKSEYLLKTEWTSETDDRNNIARLSSNMMSLLGVSEDDKILIKFGNKFETLRVLVNDELTDYQIGIPAPTRRALGMNSINDIVIVHRDMAHIFLRHSEEQTIAILGTVLAVFQVFKKSWVGVILCIIFIPIIMYFVLNEERVKVK